MQVMKLQLNTSAEINQDLEVELVNELTNQSITTTPFLDGTVSVRNLEPAPYRLRIRHPNLVQDIFDQRVRVFPDRPTFVPVRIPPDIFKDTPVRDIAEANLAPVRDKLQVSGDSAQLQANKRGGQPIFADDWNDLSSVVGDIAQATVDLTGRVSATGHDHPELIEKIDEIQGNLQRFLDVFGRSLTELQRQIEQVALQQRTDNALDNIPDLDPGVRGELRGLIGQLDDVRLDNSYAYTSRRKRVGEALAARLADIVPDDPDVRTNAAVSDLTTTADVMSATVPVNTFEAELRNTGRVDREVGTAGLSLLLRR